MNAETFFLTLFLGWYISCYGIPQNLLPLLLQFYHKFDEFFYYYNNIIYPEYFNLNDYTLEKGEVEGEV